MGISPDVLKNGPVHLKHLRKLSL